MNSHDSKHLKAYQAAQQTRTSQERDSEILRHLPLVHSVVERIAIHLPPHIDKEDLFHAGVIGLIDALDRFDASRKNAFSTYAVLRIRGSILDELRSRDVVSRNMRMHMREYKKAIHELTHSLDRLPNDEELIDYLDISADDLFEIERQSQFANQISLDAPHGEQGTLGSIVNSRNDEQPCANIEREDQQQMLHKIINSLKEQERLIIKLYYFEGLLMKEIAMVLDLTESRICQIHSRLVTLLRVRLEKANLGAL
ncbi:MAG: FliA/WhiG family RNA polymerase sigma factor [Planctomycetes bacterium]|nr:FliA/WhiG family RNA polymerase sigma factor [Planctomycetota bacterium]